MTGLATDVAAVLDDGLASVERQLGPLLVAALKQAHTDVVAMCVDEEAAAEVSTGLLNDTEDRLADVLTSEEEMRWA